MQERITGREFYQWLDYKGMRAVLNVALAEGGGNFRGCSMAPTRGTPHVKISKARDVRERVSGFIVLAGHLHSAGRFTSCWNTSLVKSIQKITTSYDQKEDRLRLAILDSEEQVFSLWVSRRLTVWMVKSLVGWLRKSAEDESDQLHAWHQEVAVATQETASPVPVMDAMDQHLVVALDLNQGSDHCRLVFRWAEEEGAAITFGVSELRQWLGIVYGVCQKAEWHDPVWPSWMPPPLPLGMLH